MNDDNPRVLRFGGFHNSGWITSLERVDAGCHWESNNQTSGVKPAFQSGGWLIASTAPPTLVHPRVRLR